MLAVAGIHWLAGAMTLARIPLSLVMNAIMYRVGLALFDRQGLRVRRSAAGFTLCALACGLVLQPASVWGYVSEMLGLRKSWGTK